VVRLNFLLPVLEDLKNKMLTRIYGTAFGTQKNLTTLVQLKKRSHRNWDET
jgi:threonyl-tRNA synthetase